MAGPVLGRLLNARLQGKFVSANLPMLHNRTVDSTGQAEFRAGVKHHDDTNDHGIDLGNEFIRQFYGDVMLFSIKKITELSFPYKATDSHHIQPILDATYHSIKANYIEKHNTVLQLKSQIHSHLNDQASWWNNMPDESENIKQAKINFNTFLKNIQSNFAESSYAYQQIFSSNHVTKYLESILHAIMHYQNDMDSWKKTLSK